MSPSVVKIFAGCLLAVLCFAGLGSLPLRETDEGFAANRAGSILRHGTWLVTYDDVDSDAPQYHKPPFIYWCVAALYKTLGYHLWSARLPTAACGFALGLFLFLIHRRAWGEGAALVCALLPFGIPFFLGHIRTAMLDVPLLALAVGAVWAFAYRGGAGGAVVAGLCSAAAVLTKGAPGFLALGTAVLVGVLRRGVNRAVLRDAAIATFLAVMPVVAYLAALPGEVRDNYLHSLYRREVAGRLRGGDWGRAVEHILLPFLANVRWYAPAAVCGLVVVCMRWRDVEVRRWLALGVLVGVPVAWVTVQETVPYARYLLPLYPGVAALAGLFCLQAGEGRWPGVLLALFAVGALAAEPSPLAWGVALCAPLVAAGSWLARRGRPRALFIARAVLLGALAAASFASPKAWHVIQRENRFYHPEIEVLAKRVPELVPPGGKLVIGHGFKLHNVLFHSQRGVESMGYWLHTTYRPGEKRYALFMHGEARALAGGEVRVVATEGTWDLAELELSPATASILGEHYKKRSP